jgi:Cdc6-like AAA superfamily ATPase
MPNETFHFTPFSLNTGVGLLFRDGAPVQLEPRAVKLLAYLVRSRGREKELSLLRAEYGCVLSGAGQPVVIKGEPGIGKTQLARHFGRWARG